MTTEIDWLLEKYGMDPAGARVKPAPSGLIHRTLIVDLADGRRLVAQRMHPIFAAAVLEDLDAVTVHLAAAGLTTPRLLRSRDGERGSLDGEGKLWRLLTYIEGFTVDQMRSTEMAHEAGALVARFHQALASLDWEFRFKRVQVHDTAGHLARLTRARDSGGHERLVALAAEILKEAKSLPDLSSMPAMISHGDLKVSNVVFHGHPARAVALIDLDTLGRLPLAFELGDALRSWCNPRGEDVEDTHFDIDIFAAAVRGYATGARPSAAEVASIVPGLYTVCVELAARFCTDGFEDSYFGWDAARFPSRPAHNLVRAIGQLNLARQVAAARALAEPIVGGAFR